MYGKVAFAIVVKHDIQKEIEKQKIKIRESIIMKYKNSVKHIQIHK